MTGENGFERPAGVYPRGGHPADFGFWNGHEWDTREIASVGTRIWTFLVDLILVGMIWFVLLIIAAIPTAGQETLPDAVGIFIFFIAPALAFIGYFAIFYATSGSSLGMMLGKLSVVDVSAGVQRLPWGRAIVRALVLLLGVYFFFTAIIWLIVTVGSSARQGPHDRAAKTIVLRQGRVQQRTLTPAPATPVNTSVKVNPAGQETREPPVASVEHVRTQVSSDISVHGAAEPAISEIDSYSEPQPAGVNEAIAAPVPAEPVDLPSGDERPVIFISHATEDAEIAAILSQELESQDLRTWLASRDVGIGTNYAAEIVRAVSNAQYLLVILSPASIESPHVRREVSIAIDRHVPVLPVSTDPTGEFMANLPVDWTYWLSLAQVFRMSDAASTAVEIARRVR